MTTSEIITQAKTNSRGASHDGPVLKTIAANTSPAHSSTVGYKNEIRARHKRQRPPSSAKLMSGMLSKALIGALQAPQCDPGKTIDSPRGTRWITTLRKLPKISQMTKAEAA